MTAKTQAEEKGKEKQPKKTNLVCIYICKEKLRLKILEFKKKFQKKLQIAISRTEHTATTKNEKLIHRKRISGPIIFQNDKNAHRISEIKLHQRMALSPWCGRTTHSVERDITRNTEWNTEKHPKP